jgi:hypothetical protein
LFLNTGKRQVGGHAEFAEASLPLHFTDWITYAAEMLRQAQHDVLFLVLLIGEQVYFLKNIKQ